MRQISCFDAYEVQFNGEGALVDPAEAAAVAQRVPQLDDLVVMSHGWNNDIAEARQLYDTFFAEFCRQWTPRAPAGRRIAVLTVLWPSKKFADRDLIPGGAAGVSDLADQAASAALEDLKGFLGNDDALERAKTVIAALDDDDEQKQREFVDILRTVIADAKMDREDGLHELFGRDGADVLRRLQRPIVSRMQATGNADVVSAAGLMDADPPDASGTQAAGLGDKLQGVKGGGLRLLNLTTYYAMKDRAGTVGKSGLAPLLERLRQANPALRLHLIGHSFGGRLVTAAASAASLDQGLRSLTLLQAAFSHYGLGAEYEPGANGAFRNILDDRRVAGPILVSQSIHDIPVGVAYAIASKLSGSVGAGLPEESPVRAAGLADRIGAAAAAGARLLVGGPNDRYGGIGRNGALALRPGEGVRVNPVLPLTQSYEFAAGRVYNLVCDTCVSGHSDICGAPLVHAVVEAVARP